MVREEASQEEQGFLVDRGSRRRGRGREERDEEEGKKRRGRWRGRKEE
jgi:hypothetical protein